MSNIPMGILAQPFGLGMSDSSYLYHANKTASATVHSYTSVPFGVEDGIRRILVFAHGYTTSQSSMTIGGVSATKFITGDAVGGYGHSSIWGAAVPTGTSGTVAVTYASAVTDNTISVVGIYSAATTVSASAKHKIGTGDGTDVTTTTTVPTTGIIFAGCAIENVVSTGIWTGLTEKWDDNSSAGRASSGGFDYYATQQTSKVISMAESNSGAYRELLTITYGP